LEVRPSVLEHINWFGDKKPGGDKKEKKLLLLKKEEPKEVIKKLINQMIKKLHQKRNDNDQYPRN